MPSQSFTHTDNQEDYLARKSTCKKAQIRVTCEEIEHQENLVRVSIANGDFDILVEIVFHPRESSSASLNA